MITAIGTTQKNTTMKLKKVIFISSMGGHLNELLQLKPLFDRCDYTIITETNPTLDSLKTTYGNRVKTLLYATKAHMGKYSFIFPMNILISFWYFITIRPDAVVTTGTHTAVPLCFIAHLFKRKVIYIETFANATTATAAGKIVYKIADVFYVQWPTMLEVYPNARYAGSVF